MRKIDADILLDEICRDQCEHKYKDCDSTCEIAAYVVNAPTIGGWISVKDRLPEQGGRYLCYAGDHPLGGFCYIVNFNPDAKEFWSYERNMSVSFITHWMPLPEPPEVSING